MSSTCHRAILAIAGLASWGCSEALTPPAVPLITIRASAPVPDTLMVADTIHVEVLVRDSEDRALAGTRLRWSSSDTSVLHLLGSDEVEPGTWRLRVAASHRGRTELAAELIDGFGAASPGVFTDSILVMERWVAVSTGLLNHTCALSVSGEAYCWGKAERGLGGGSLASSTRPVRVSDDVTFTGIDAGASFTCGTVAGGVSLCWGRNEVGQLGDGGQVDRLAVGSVVGGFLFSAVTTGHSFTCGIADNLATYCWGDASRGQSGFGPATPRCPFRDQMVFIWCNPAPTLPVRVGNAAPARSDCVVVRDVTSCALRLLSISAGFFHACGVAPSGALFCWGDNTNGKLGGVLGDDECPAPWRPCSTFAIRVGEPADWYLRPTEHRGPLFTQVSAGEGTCGIGTDSLAYCSGQFAGTVYADTGFYFPALSQRACGIRLGMRTYIL